MKPRRLHDRLMLAFAGFALVVATVFGLYAMVFMYVVEDAFFEAMLDQEADAQLRQHASTGRWSVPREASVTLHSDTTTFPADLGMLHDAEPERHEFPGAGGRHYHLRRVTPPAPAEPMWLVAEVSDQLVVRPMRERVVALLATTGAGILVLALSLGYWIARRIARPLARLAALVDTMTPDRLPRHVPRDFADEEVGVLARGLDGLTKRVQAFIAREQEFTRDASHELRTPLTVILSAAERLEGDAGLSTASRLQLAHVKQSVLQLQRTVATLLSLAREEGPTDRAEPVRLVPVLERVIVEQSPLLEGKDVEVELAIPWDAKLVLPPAVLHILLSNLVGNAFAHTDAGEVRIDLVDDRLRIANSADGPARTASGTSPLGGRREGSGGSGFGLAIVRRLCERYDIDLRIDVEGERVVASVAAPGAIGALPTAGGP